MKFLAIAVVSTEWLKEFASAQECRSQFCVAAPGEPCRDENGSPVTWFHVPRRKDAVKAYLAVQPADVIRVEIA